MDQVVPITVDHYTRGGDVAVMALCVVTAILLLTSYVSRTRSYRIFINIIVMIFAAAFVNIGGHCLLTADNPRTYALIYGMRVFYHALLYDIFTLFVLYTAEVSGLELRKMRIAAVTGCLLLVALVAVDTAMGVTGAGWDLAEGGMILHNTSLFMIGYGLYIILLISLMTRVRHLLYKRVLYGFFGTMALSVAIVLTQLFLHESSLTTMTFMFPVVAMLYIMHSNPYNVRMGTVDTRAMEDMVRNMSRRKIPFVYFSIFFPEYNAEGRTLPLSIQDRIRTLPGRYFRQCVLFQISNGYLVMIAPKRSNPGFENRFVQLAGDVAASYRFFQVPYKVVAGESMEEISRKNEYASLIRDITRGMEENTVHRVVQGDLDRFNRNEYILGELADICDCRNPEDPRVLAYCQPVFNLKTGQFDTAEALMRLNLAETGIIYPDQFIPLAEAHGYIHALTEIILHKTCRGIRKLTGEGFSINRISINVSVLELKEDTFCEDIDRIIANNRVPGDKIAIELTETGNEEDFLLMKGKIEELRREGVKFYLDDFGTGYSNMERIMELPFDIIKFDRSLVAASGTDERSEKIVENLAHLFRDMDYSVLYEGVENDTDEARCREMSASYLQGYKYSRPVPIEQLKDFLSQAG